MNKEKLKQWFCGAIKGHGHSSASASEGLNTVAGKSWCPDCQKVFSLFISEDATEEQKNFILNAK